MARTEKQRGDCHANDSKQSSDGFGDVENAANLLAAIVNSSFDAIIGKDLRGIVTSWNGAAEQMFGYTADEMIGQSITRLIPPALQSEEVVILSQLKQGVKIEHFETTRLKKSGEAIDVSVTISPIRNLAGEIIGASKVARDITERKRVEAAVLESEARFRTMADSIPQLAWIADAAGQVYWYNQRWHDYTGMTPEDMQGLGRRSMLDATVLPEILARWATAISSGEPFEMEFPVRRFDGEFHPFLTRVQPVKDSEGTIVQWFGTNTDVSELKQMETALRETQARLKSTLGAAEVGTWTWDISSNILMADEFTALVFSLEADRAAQGLPVEAYLAALHDEDQPLVAAELSKAIEECGNYNVEFRVRQENGEYLWLHSRGRVEADDAGRATLFHGAVIDISEHKKAQETIQALNTDLEQRVAIRTAQLEDTARELEAFSYSVSHDLQAPLRSMNGFSQVVLDEYGPLLPEEGQRYLRSIRSGSKKLAALIGDMLSFASTSHQPIRREEVDTDKLVRSLLTDLIDQQKGRQIEVNVGALPPCLGDPALLELVWTNLLANAIKYTQKRDITRIDVGWELSPEGGAYFVRDNGAGFDMKYADKLFSVFYRLHSSQDYEGSGVGLATVQRIIQRHGGRIWAEAQENQGATFHFTLGTEPTE
jgi:PAS domain S-box-containing protein